MKPSKLLRQAWRKRDWMLRPLTPSKVVNSSRAGLAFAAGSERVSAMPTLVKVDISPVCNLRCTVCVHAQDDSDERLAKQVFRKSQRMHVDQYSRLLDELRGKTVAVSLYTWGDPLHHPDLDEICARTAAAGLGSHISSNFGMRLSDERIESLVASGLGHITVCVDGLTQETYAKTRVGGNIARVLHNLRRLAEARDRATGTRLFIEVQFIRFQHNQHEEQAARKLVDSLGVDSFASFWGSLNNAADLMPDRYRTVGPKQGGVAPKCAWPWFATVVKYNGDVVPCCDFRAAAQYVGKDSRGDAAARVLGNVFDTSLAEIWNAEAYRMVRRVAANPSGASAENLADSFCSGCARCFDTEAGKQRLSGVDKKYEDVYVQEAGNVPVRRRA